jgi:glycosyltransferase involved in cell wall biosynthesis
MAVQFKSIKSMAPDVRVTALICALNEEANLSQVLPKIPTWVDEVLLVDGHSSDKTVEMARGLCPNINILYQPGRGKGDALRHGIMHASGDVIVLLDADGATDPQEMPKFISPLLDGYEFAKGTRFLGKFPRGKRWYRVFGNFLITATFDMLFLRRYTDLCSGYNAFWKKAIDGLDIHSPDGFENEPLIHSRIAKKKLKVIEVVHSDNGRLTGDVKELTWRQGFKAIKTIIRERFCG